LFYFFIEVNLEQHNGIADYLANPVRFIKVIHENNCDLSDHADLRVTFNVNGIGTGGTCEFATNCKPGG
jgi:hypothetical protein